MKTKTEFEGDTFEECSFTLSGKRDAYLSDRIKMPLTPFMVRFIAGIFEQRALAATAYTNQTIERSMRDLFQDAFNKYSDIREKHDRMKEEEDE